MKLAQAINLPTRSKLFTWLNTSIPVVVQNWIVEQKGFKACGAVSGYLSSISLHNGYPIYQYNTGGNHIINVAFFDEGELEIDLTHVQFEFEHGSLRDFSRDERDSEEYILMKKKLEEAANNPFSIVKIKELPKNSYSLDDVFTSNNEFLDLKRFTYSV